MVFNKKVSWSITFIIAILFVGYIVSQPFKKSDYVHYHANYAIFVDGQRLDLSEDKYMEDTVKCSASHQIEFAEDRGHMHENEDHVMHVHDEGVTWGHLMANIGFGMGKNYLYTDQGFFKGEDEKTLKFILNGQPHPDPTNKIVRSEDRLLISFGPETAAEVAEAQFSRVESDAWKYNEADDPNCGSGR